MANLPRESTSFSSALWAGAQRHAVFAHGIEQRARRAAPEEGRHHAIGINDDPHARVARPVRS